MVNFPQNSKRFLKKKKGIKIDMIPMVDVAFLLLLCFFVINDEGKKQKMEIYIPESNGCPVIEDPNVIVLRVSENFKIYWNIGPEIPKEIEFTKLRFFLREKNQQMNSKLSTLIKIDKKAKYMNMVDIIDELKVADITRFNLAPFTDDDKKAIENI